MIYILLPVRVFFEYFLLEKLSTNNGGTDGLISMTGELSSFVFYSAYLSKIYSLFLFSLL